MKLNFLPGLCVSMKLARMIDISAGWICKHSPLHPSMMLNIMKEGRDWHCRPSSQVTPASYAEKRFDCLILCISQASCHKGSQS